MNKGRTVNDSNSEKRGRIHRDFNSKKIVADVFQYKKSKYINRARNYPPIRQAQMFIYFTESHEPRRPYEERVYINMSEQQIRAGINGRLIRSYNQGKKQGHDKFFSDIAPINCICRPETHERKPDYCQFVINYGEKRYWNESNHRTKKNNVVTRKLHGQIIPLKITKPRRSRATGLFLLFF